MSPGTQHALPPSAWRRLSWAWPSLLAWWLARGLAALLPAVVLGRAAGRALGHHERGELALLAGGGELLLEALGVLRVEAEALGVTAAGALLLSSPLLAMAAGAVVLQAQAPGVALGSALRGALARTGSLLLLWGTALCAQALLLLIGVTAFGGAAKALVSDTPRGGAVFLALAALVVVPAWVLGVVYQLARVEVALGAGLYEAAQRSLERLRRDRARVFAWALAASAFASACAIASAAALELVWRASWLAALGAVLAELGALGAVLARSTFIAWALGLRDAEGAPAESECVAPPQARVSPDLSTPLHRDGGLE